MCVSTSDHVFVIAHGASISLGDSVIHDLTTCPRLSPAAPADGAPELLEKPSLLWRRSCRRRPPVRPHLVVLNVGNVERRLTIVREEGLRWLAPGRRIIPGILLGFRLCWVLKEVALVGSKRGRSIVVIVTFAGTLERAAVLSSADPVGALDLLPICSASLAHHHLRQRHPDLYRLC